MGEILRNWLHLQLGVKVNFDPIYLGKMFQDGVLFKQILNNYGIISDSHSMSVSHNTDFKSCQQNLRQLCVWFNLLNIKFNEATITEIASGQCSTIIRLLYEMFLCFENKQHLYFVTKQNQRNIKQSIQSRFQLGNVTETKLDEDKTLSLERPLVENKGIIEWYKEKFSLLKEKLKTSHTVHLCNTDLKGINLNQEIKTNNKWQTHDNNSTPVSDLDDYSKSLLMDNEINSKEHLPTVVLPKDEYLSMLRLNKHKNAVKKCLAKKMQTALLNSVWHKVHESHEHEFNNLFSKLLTKQSQYEKQIVMKLSQEHESNTLQIPPEIMVEKEKEHLCNLQLQDEFEKGKEMYEDEKHRILELHHRLYAEKQQQKAEENYNLCAEVLDSIINISFRVSEFKKINSAPVPESEWNDWKQLFFKSLDIPDIFVEQIISDDGDDDSDGNSVGVISLIQDYDDILNEHSLYEYLYYVGTWFAEELCPDLGSPNEDEQIVLGYVVHRLLELKYPFPPSPKPAELPPMRVTAMVQGIQDSTAIKKLKMLLTKSGISVLEIDDVLKFSIDTYKNETNDPNTEKTKKLEKTSKKSSKSKSTKKSKDKGLPKKEKITNKEKRKSKSKPKKGDGSKSSEKIEPEPEKENSSDNLDNYNIETIMENEKRTQTPAVLPEDDGFPKRTDFGLIGEQIFNALNSGIPVSDCVLVSTLIEYLKTQLSIKGWILVNFPDSIVQASLLELALTGREIPNVEIAKSSNSQNEVVEKNELETMDELRFSKLVPYPSEIHKLEDFKTYFNSVIYTKVKTLEKTDILLEDVSNTTSTIVEEDPVLLSVENFYKTQSGFYEFYYDQLDLNNLKQLARYILAETDTERTPSVELFGEEILKALTVKSSSKKKANKSEGMKQKPKKSLKKSVKRNQESEVLKSEDTEIICLDEPILENNETEKILKGDVDEVEPLKPGDSGWSYAQFDIPNTLAIVLATQWENFETSYLQNLKQQFFNKRTLLSHLMPYKNFVSKTIRSLIEQSDNKQNLITEFQEFHNSIDEHLLLFVEMKNEMHCKVFELQNKLWSICDERKASTAQKIKEIINDNWVTIEMCALTNAYLSLAQLELNRFINTLNLLNDYYTLMLGRIPSDHKDNFSISTLDLNLLKGINSESIDSITYTINQKYKTGNIFDYIFKLLNNTIIGDDLVNPFCILLEKNINTALENITKIGYKFGDGIRKEENLSIPPKQKTQKSPPKIKTQKDTKLKKNSKTNKTHEESITVLQNNHLDESVILKRNLFEEWKFVLENEVKRVKYKCDLIKCRGVLDLTDFLNEMLLTFHSLFHEIYDRYYLDIETVDNICKIISTAIEEETKIPQKLIISDAKLFVTKQISSEKLLWPKELFEQKYTYIVSSEQARFLMEDFKTAAPWGYISKIPLVYILEDILIRDMHENMKRLPEIWSDLEPKELKEIVDKIFGNVLLVDWRDLILFCLNIPFPTVEELLSTQKECINMDPDENETLDFESFTNITFWFEKELAESPQDRLKFVNVKNLLYSLFEDESNNVNYPSLLLSFCKDIEPGVGFGKALALAVHKRIILCESDLYLERMSVCSHNLETYQVVTNVLSGLINMVLISTECPIITEVEEDDIVISECMGEKFSSSLGEHKLSKSQTSENFNRTSNILKSMISSSTISKHSSKGSQKTFSSEQKSQPHESVTQSTASHSAKSELCCVSLCSTLEEYWAFISEVSVETILTVIVTSMIPRNNSLNIQQTLDDLNELSVDGNIPVHLLLDLPCMTDLFSNSQKFNLHVMHEVIREIIQERSMTIKN